MDTTKEQAASVDRRRLGFAQMLLLDSDAELRERVRLIRAEILRRQQGRAANRYRKRAEKAPQARAIDPEDTLISRNG